MFHTGFELIKMEKWNWNLALLVHYFQIEFKFGVLIFVEEGNLEKNPQSKDENQQQTQPTSDTRVRNQTQVTVVGGKHSLHCTIPTSNSYCPLYLLYFLITHT